MTNPDAIRTLLARAPLMVIVGHGAAGRTALDDAAAAIAGGARLLQLRMERATDRTLLETARRLAALCRDRGASLVVNDRVDIAVAAGARGVHLGLDDLPVAAARSVAGPNLWIGATVHGPAEVAASDGADYVGLGTVFPSPTKPGLSARGPALLRETCPLLDDLPVIAIGGVGPSNARTCLEAGAQGVAVASAVTAAPDPEQATRRLLAAMHAESA
jgi:thiamine-phosphate pyrophosphorylase